MSGVPSIPGSDRIRALSGDAVFEAFDAYPWRMDGVFMSALQAMLGNPADSTSERCSPEEMAIHARIFYYAQRVGVTIQFAKYRAWADAHPLHRAPTFPPDVFPQSVSSPSSRGGEQGGGGGDGEDEEEVEEEEVEEEEEEEGEEVAAASSSAVSGTQDGAQISALADQLDRLSAGSSESRAAPAGVHQREEQPEAEVVKGMANEDAAGPLPPWQASAPKVALYIDRADRPPPIPPPPPPPLPPGTVGDPALSGSARPPEYPMRFADMIRMLQANLPVPGIRQIPDTVIRDPISKPFGARVAPRKPWEKESTETGGEHDGVIATPDDKIGLEFPVLEDEGSSS